MMYNSGLVCVVKANGKILRESRDEVYLPFGTEYSIFLKNLESRKCLVKISIDGQDVLDGNSLIISGNSETELEGFMKGKNAKNKFKFIRKTQEISDFRGDRIDDGIIRVEYWFEKIFEKRHVITEHCYHYYHHYNCCGNCAWCSNWSCSKRYNNVTHTYSTPTFGSVTSSTSKGASSGSLSSDTTSINYNISTNLNNIGSSVNCFSAQAQMRSVGDEQLTSKAVFENYEDPGITVKGSEVNQVFNYGNIGQLEDNSRVIILKLIGVKESGVVIEKPITVQSKKQCPTCGKKSKSHLKYCSACGTFLE